MALLGTAALIFCTLAPQEPVPSPVASISPHGDTKTFRMVELLPGDAIGALLINPLDSHRASIEGCHLVRLLQEKNAIPGLRAEWLDLLANLTNLTDIPEDHVEQALTSGMVFSWNGVLPDGSPEWLWISDLGNTANSVEQAMPRILDTLRRTGAKTREEKWGSYTLWSVRTRNGTRFCFGKIRHLLVVAHDLMEVSGAISRLEGRSKEPTLADIQSFRDFDRFARVDGEPVFGLYGQPGVTVDKLLTLVTGKENLQLRRVIKALHLGQIAGVGFALHVRNGMLHESMRIFFPEPRDGLIAALLAPRQVSWDRVERLVPPEAWSFAATHLSWATVVDEALGVLKAVDPQYLMLYESWETSLEQAMGVNLRGDLLHLLDDRLVALSLPTLEGTGEAKAFVVTVSDAPRFARAIERLRSMVPFPVRKTIVGGTTQWQLDTFAADEGEAMPGVALHKSYFVGCSDSRLLPGLMAFLLDPKPNQAVIDFVKGLDPAANSATWADLDRMMPAMVAHLSAATGGATEFTLPEGMSFGNLESSITTDSLGITYRSSSSMGNIHAIAALTTLGAKWFADRGADLGQRVSGLAGRADDLDHGSRIAAIAAAEDSFRQKKIVDEDRDGHGEFGSLDHLVAFGLLQRELLGQPLGNGVWQERGHLFSVLLPETIDGREAYFLAGAWPADERTGMVYAATPRQTAMANDLLAAAMGIQLLDMRDVYGDHQWGGKLTSGWRMLEGATVGAGSPRQASKAQQAAERIRMRRVAAQGRNADTGELIELLQASTPEIAGRAAWLLGELKATEAVPALSDLLQETHSKDVQALCMAALHKMPDPRALKAAIAALDLEDIRARALAASTLGKLRRRESIQPLLGLLGRNSGDGSDKVQALLALHDIGDPSCLLAAATAVGMGQPSVEEALVYLLQELTAKLQPAEQIDVLIGILDHESPMVRRYSIQQLGEIGDRTHARALEGRLTHETGELRGLVEVSLAMVRGENFSTDPLGETRRFLERVWQDGNARWNKMTREQRLTVAGCGGVMILGLMTIVWLGGRRRRRLQAASMVAMVAPSDEFLATHGQEAHDDEYQDDYAEESHEETWSGHN